MLLCTIIGTVDDEPGRGDVSDEGPSPALPAPAEEVEIPAVVGCWMMKRSARREVATAGSSGAMSLERKRRRVWGRVFYVSYFLYFLGGS